VRSGSGSPPTSLSELPEYALRNRESWTRSNEEYTAARAQGAWARQEVDWGVFHVPEADVRALPDVGGKDVIELGCGTAYFGAWLKRLGAARVVGVDVTPAQLETARRMDAEFGLGLELVEANAEDVPFPDASFDVAVSEYGASIWCDPYLWIPEAARLLRPGGELVFLRNSTLAMLCATLQGTSETLQRPQRGLHRLDWEDDGTTEFHLAHGDWVRLLRTSGFDLVDLIELYAPDDAVDHPYYTSDAAWAKRWPWEEIWRARKRDA
jgi:SAM-dependent methyltransferase